MVDIFESREPASGASTHLVALVALSMIAVSSMISPQGLAVDVASSARSIRSASADEGFREGEYVIFIGDRAYRAYLIPERDI